MTTTPRTEHTGPVERRAASLAVYASENEEARWANRAGLGG